MAVSYKKLWHILVDRDMKKKDLEALAGLSHYTMSKMSRDENVTTEVLGKVCAALDCNVEDIIGQHRTIAEASAVESPIRQETIGFPAHFFARAHNFKPPGRACQPEADSPMRT